MTATDVLRRLLDERGVEWDRGKLAMLDDEYTQWWVSDRMEGFVAYECDYPLNTLIVRGITPEQAIAATLGATDANPTQAESSGTCRDVWDTELTGRLRFQCSECGAVSLEITPRFCPVCGRKVVGE